MAAPNSIVKIIEFCKIIPKNAPSEFSLPLTFLDMIWLGQDPASRLFFYEIPEQNTDFLNTILPKLIKSLSTTLQHYLPVAGYLTWPQDSNSPVIHYNTGDGVSLTIAETLSDFNSLSGNEFRDSAELRTLLPDFPTSETQTPVMTLQITFFPNKGFSIGYVAHHGVMDGKSVSMFMHSWAYLCKNGDSSVLPLELTPYFDRSFVKQQAELERIYPKRFGGKPLDLENKSLLIADVTFPPDVMLGTLRLSRENIDNLKKSMSDYKEKKNEHGCVTRISTFTVSSAYAMVCFIKSKKLVSGKTLIGINVDARARLDPPIPSSYFGNCVVGCGFGSDTSKFLDQDGFVVAVKTVSQGLDMLNEGIVKLAEKLNMLIAAIPRDIKPKDVPIVFVIAGSPQFKLYKVDFGWGSPRKVEMISIAKTGAFYLSDDREGNGTGIEIGVALKKHEAQVFKSVFVCGLQTC